MPYLVLNVAALDFLRSGGAPVRWTHEDAGKRCRLGPKSFRAYVRELSQMGWITIDSEVTHKEYVISPSLPAVLSETEHPYWNPTSKQRRKDEKRQAWLAKHSPA